MPNTSRHQTRRQKMARSNRTNRRKPNAAADDQIIAYMYSNVSGTRPISTKGPAFLVLGSFSSVGELVGHVNRVYGRKGPQCTILQTPKNTFVPLLSPEKPMLEYPVQRAAIHTKALMSLYQEKRRREKKEFDSARAEQRPGTVDKNSRTVRKRLEKLQDLGLDAAPESQNSEALTDSTESPADSPDAKSEGSAGEPDQGSETDSVRPNAETSSPATVQTLQTPKSTVTPLDPRVKLVNQNYAVVSIIHDERKDRSGAAKNTKALPLEPVVSFLDTFATQQEAEEFAKKANSKEVPGAPLFVVQMYSWLFTEDVSIDSIPVSYPEQPLLERVINNHQRVQEQGESEFIQGADVNHADPEPNTPDAKRPAHDPSISTSSGEAPDEKRAPTPTTTPSDNENEAMARAIERDDVLSILRNRVLKRPTSESSDAKAQ